ncbi:MAG: hypothetical protein HY362_03755 [Candidatus Aenigmarchaeota archaeon]|nr:hypothetical protein [Candidatus Aenigmarchaeota archaeon]
MRGAINTLTAAIIAILVILLAAALLVVVIPNMQNINKWIQDIVSGHKPGTNGGGDATVFVSEPFGSLAKSDPTQDSQPETSTRIACKIARAMQADLLAHGVNPRVVDEQKKIQGTDLALIATERFIIEKNPATGNPWKAEDLTAEQLKKLKEYCSDTGSFTPCPSHFDEACITAALSHLNASEVPLCSSLSVPGAASFAFGNKVCSSSSEWSFDCGVCGAADSVKNAKAQASKFGNKRDELEVDDTKLSNTAFPPECKGGDCTPQYSWALYWDKSDKAYHYEIPKISLGDEKGRTAPQGVALSLADTFKTTPVRSTAAGFAKPEFRTIYNTTFVPATEYNINSFTQDFTSRIGKIRIAPDIDFGGDRKASGVGDYIIAPTEQCQGNMCYATSIIEKKYKEYYTNAALAHYTASDLVNCKNLNKDLRTFKIKTSVEPNTLLRADHRYNVVLNKWERTPVLSEKNEGYCIKDDMCIVSGSWCGGQGLDSWKQFGGYIDYSLVLVDLGQLRPDIVVKSISLEPQKLTATPTNPNPSVTITYDIANIGDVETSAFEVTVSSGADSKKITAPNIPAKGSIRQTVTLSPGLGADRVVVFADTKEEVEETNEENNKGSATFSVEGTDILVSDFAIPANGVVRSQIQIDAVIENRGSIPVSNFLVALVVNSKTISTQTIDILQQSGSGREKLGVRFQWTPDTAGVKEIKVIADSANSVTEVNEQNNERSGTMTIKEV